jgi:serine/threonine-protein kinase RsbW
MFSVGKTLSSIEFKISSEVHLIGKVLQEFEKYCQQLKVKEPSSLIIVLQELLNNAVVHGNREDVNRYVICSIEKLNVQAYKIVVEDEGIGFDYRNLNMSLPDDLKHVRRRGYPIISALTNRIEFSESGSKITAFLTIANENGTQPMNSEKTRRNAI